MRVFEGAKVRGYEITLVFANNSLKDLCEKDKSRTFAPPYLRTFEHANIRTHYFQP